MKKTPTLLLIALVAALAAPASGQSVPQPELSDRLINLPSHKTVGYGVIQAVFTHRFSQTVSDGGFSDLGGLDSSADIGLGVTFGFGPRWQAELYRSSFFKEWELALKWNLARQGADVPLGLAVRLGGAYRSADNLSDRSTGFVQGIVSRRLTPWLDVFLIPVWASDTPTLTNAFNLPVAASVHLPKRWDLVLEVVPPNGDADDAEVAWAVGFNKRIRGHAFLIYLGNSRATTADLIAGSDLPGGFAADDVRLGFNITRRFPE